VSKGFARWPSGAAQRVGRSAAQRQQGRRSEHTPERPVRFLPRRSRRGPHARLCHALHQAATTWGDRPRAEYRIERLLR
jgi:hypothetical protein